MVAFLSRRLAQLVPTLFFVSVIIFLLQQLLPGDPALVMAGEERDPAVLEQIRACTGLYIAGGDQRMVAQALLGRDGRGTPALAVIREVYERGGVVAGSSAGAAVMPNWGKSFSI